MLDISKLKYEYAQYRCAANQCLQNHMPAFLKVEIRSFKTFANKLADPCDQLFISAMQQTMKTMCEKIQGCLFGFTCSNEIILIVTDRSNWNSVAWMNYDSQKMCSVAASMATLTFNRYFEQNLQTRCNEEYSTSFDGALFESTCFNVPAFRLCNMIYYKQMDTRKNSIQNLGAKYFGKAKIIGKCNDEVINMLREEANVDWTQMPNSYKIGSCCVKNAHVSSGGKWQVIDSMPLFDENGQNILLNTLRSANVNRFE